MAYSKKWGVGVVSESKVEKREQKVIEKLVFCNFLLLSGFLPLYYVIYQHFIILLALVSNTKHNFNPKACCTFTSFYCTFRDIITLCVWVRKNPAFSPMLVILEEWG